MPVIGISLTDDVEFLSSEAQRRNQSRPPAKITRSLLIRTALAHWRSALAAEDAPSIRQRSRNASDSASPQEGN